MAYRRRPRRTTTRFRRRTTGRSKRISRRITRRPATRGRFRSKRSILNVTSRKKRNGMLSWSNTNPDGLGVNALGIAPAFVSGSASTSANQPCGVFFWNATAQSLFANGNGGNAIINTAERTATTCYMRGLSEHVRIQTYSGIPWFHRRICFTYKSPLEYVAGTDAAPVVPNTTYADTSNGIERLWLNLTINKNPQYSGNLYGLIFKGRVLQDWTDPIIAPLDTSRINVKFDKTFKYTSGNAAGMVREMKLWHPMNRNLIYDDDELGAGENGSYYSVENKQGMGNYFVMDLFTPGANAASGDIIRIDSNATLYWHEK